MSAGTYSCTNCGNELKIESSQSLPPCPECQNGQWNTVSGGDAEGDPA